MFDRLRMWMKGQMPVVKKGLSDWVMQQEAKWWLLGLPLPTYYGNRVTKPFEQSGTVYNAVSKIAKNISKVDMEFYNEKDKEGANPITDHPFLETFQNNPELTQKQLLEGSVQHLELRGDAFWHFVMDLTRKTPKYIDLLMPEKMSYKTIGREIFWYYEMEEVKDTFHFKYINPYHAILGASPSGPAQIEYETDYSAARWNKRFFDRNGMPTGLIKLPPGMPLDDKTKLAMKEQWLAMLGQGEDGTNRSIGVLGGGADWQDLSTNQHDAEFIGGRRFSREQILAIFDVPPAVAGVFEYANYANSEQQILYFWYNNLLPKIAYLEDKINQILRYYKTGLVCFFKVESVPALIADMMKKTDSAYKLWQMGLSFADANDRLEMGFNTEGKPHLQQGYLPFNLVPAESIAAAGEEPTWGPSKKTGPKKLDAVKNQARELIRTAQWQKSIMPIYQLERGLREKLKKFFYQLRKETLRNLERVMGKSFEKAGANETAGTINFDLELAKDGIVKVSSKYIDESFNIGAENIFAEAGVTFSFNYLDQRVTQFLAEKKNLIKTASETIWNKVQGTLIEGIEEGESITQLGDRIREVFNVAESHAFTIARTETAQSFNGGRYEALTQAKERDICKEHEWLSARDERVRESHQIDGEVVEVGSLFSNGLKYPGDLDGDPSEIINCRCDTLPVIKE